MGVSSPLVIAAVILGSSLLPPAAAGEIEPLSKVHTFLLLDRSGSMQAIRDEMIGSLNSYISDTQAAEHAQHALLTLAQFDSQEPFELIYDAHNLTAVPPLTRHQFSPRSLTPLYDAIASTIAHADQRAAMLREAGEPSEAVVVVVLTDGAENASREHSQQSVMKMVQQREKESGWTFVFLGANIDAYKQGGHVGISKSNTQNFAFDQEGTRKAFVSLSRATTHYYNACLLYTSDAADDLLCVDLGGRRIIKKKNIRSFSD
eukprot:TRINITY_DN662_c0_g1_i1.p1 TRINITY_DN662_c0_g1~~TRINITY_DN662_c0_g1_i1.p1  ORF type:complete len:261 (-),score=68.83 TRINITY_DN662_c0_g1_i1:66-848(-)